MLPVDVEIVGDLPAAQERGISVLIQSWNHAMKSRTRIRPISHLKANAARVIREVVAARAPVVLTHNGVAKAVIQDVASYDETQETMALLKILVLGNRQIEAGQVMSARDAIRRLRRDAKKIG